MPVKEVVGSNPPESLILYSREIRRIQWDEPSKFDKVVDFYFGSALCRMDQVRDGRPGQPSHLPMGTYFCVQKLHYSPAMFLFVCKGDELGCRVRQLRLLGRRASVGQTAAAAAAAASAVPPPARTVVVPASGSQHQLGGGGGGTFADGAKSDAFALFQSLAAQVFDAHMTEAPEAGAGGTLREQVKVQ